MYIYIEKISPDCVIQFVSIFPILFVFILDWSNVDILYELLFMKNEHFDFLAYHPFCPFPIISVMRMNATIFNPLANTSFWLAGFSSTARMM